MWSQEALLPVAGAACALMMDCNSLAGSETTGGLLTLFMTLRDYKCESEKARSSTHQGFD